jgi:hypothetical protein
MPYTYKKQDSKYCVYKKDGGKKVGCTAGNKTALKRYLNALHMAESIDLEERVIAAVNELLSEDLRAWFGKGGKGGVGGGGWDRYNSKGDRVGKCGDADEGDAYAACLSKEKARKLGKAGRAAFVKRKRAAQRKGGDAKKGGEQAKGQKPIKVKTGVNEIGEANAEPFKFSRSSLSDKNITYSFKTDSSLEYIAEFDLIDSKPTYEYSFKTKDGDYTDTTNKGELARIMSTLVKILLDFLEQSDNKANVMIDPAKVDKEDNRRGKLYQLYVKKNLPTEYESKTVDGDNILITPKGIQENFADGKKPGRKGLSKRFGISQKMSIAQLEKIAKTATGERRRMAQWNLNMKRGRKNENLEPGTFKDTGKSSPYGSGYQELEERLNLFLEKNIPTNPEKWSYYKGQAKKKFDVYPSAYANAWAAKMYKKAGGGWRKGK